MGINFDALKFILFSVENESNKYPKADEDVSFELPCIDSNMDWWELDDDHHSQLKNFDSYPDTMSTSESEIYNFSKCMDSESDSGISMLFDC